MSDIKSTYYLYINLISKVLCHFVVVDWIVYLCLNGQFGGKIMKYFHLFFSFVIIWDLDTSNSINENVDVLSFKKYIYLLLHDKWCHFSVPEIKIEKAYLFFFKFENYLVLIQKTQKSM